MEIQLQTILYFCGFSFFILICLVLSIFKNFNIYNKDMLLMLDKNSRWKIIAKSLSKKTTIDLDDNKYHLNPEAGILSKKGKSLYVFSEGRPEPLKLQYQKIEWLDAKSLSGVINNKLVQQIIRPADKLLDTLLMIGAIGGILSLIASVIILLIITGVIKKS